MSTPTPTVYGPRKRSKLDLMGIRFDRDEGDESTKTGEGAGDEEKPEIIGTVANPPKPKPGTQTVDPATDDTKTGDDSDDPAVLKAQLAEARREAAKNRIDRKEDVQRQIDEALANGQKAWAKELGKTLGVIEDETESSPEAVAAAVKAENDTLKQQLASEKAERAAEKATAAQTKALADAATTHGGDLTLVNAVVKADDLLKDIDTTADDYAAQVALVVKDAIEKNPKLRTVQVTTRSGGDDTHTGDPITEADSVEKFEKAYRKRHGFRD